MNHEFTCHICGKTKTHENDISTGYGVGSQGLKVCFDCCAYEDKAQMILDGKTILYLQHETGKGYGEVVNWPGTLRMKAAVRKGSHNIARYRYDAWFLGPDGKDWHGVQYGDNTQIIHCKRLKG